MSNNNMANGFQLIRCIVTIDEVRPSHISLHNQRSSLWDLAPLVHHLRWGWLEELYLNMFASHRLTLMPQPRAIAGGFTIHRPFPPFLSHTWSRQHWKQVKCKVVLPFVEALCPLEGKKFEAKIQTGK